MRRAGDRFRTRAGLGRTLHSFSFGDHYDPANVGVRRAGGAQRRDGVAAGRGYRRPPAPRHRDRHLGARRARWCTRTPPGNTRHRASRAGAAAERGLRHRARRAQRRLPARPGRRPRSRCTSSRCGCGPTRPAPRRRTPQRAARPGRPAAAAGCRSPPARTRRGDRPGQHAARRCGSTRLGRGRRPHPARGAARLHVFVARGVVEVETVGALGPGRRAAAVRARRRCGSPAAPTPSCWSGSWPRETDELPLLIRVSGRDRPAADPRPAAAARRRGRGAGGHGAARGPRAADPGRAGPAGRGRRRAWSATCCSGASPPG